MDSDLRRCFDAYLSSDASFFGLVSALASAQKHHPDGYDDWITFVLDVCTAIEMHDAGLFPDSWWPECLDCDNPDCDRDCRP